MVITLRVYDNLFNQAITLRVYDNLFNQANHLEGFDGLHGGSGAFPRFGQSRRVLTCVEVLDPIHHAMVCNVDWKERGGDQGSGVC